jgi:hypothetical protein
LTPVVEGSGTKVRRFKEFHDAAASWSRVERIIARVELGSQGCDTRFPPRPPGRVPFRNRIERLLTLDGREPHRGVEGPPMSLGA